MSDFFKLLATFKPPQPLLDHLNKYPKMSDEARRWLSMWPHWDSWVIELEKRMTDDDERLLKELATLFDTEVEIKEVVPQQATLIEIPDKVQI